MQYTRQSFWYLWKLTKTTVQLLRLQLYSWRSRAILSKTVQIPCRKLPPTTPCSNSGRNVFRKSTKPVILPSSRRRRSCGISQTHQLQWILSRQLRYHKIKPQKHSFAILRSVLPLNSKLHQFSITSFSLRAFLPWQHEWVAIQQTKPSFFHYASRITFQPKLQNSKRHQNRKTPHLPSHTRYSKPTSPANIQTRIRLRLHPCNGNRTSHEQYFLKQTPPLLLNRRSRHALGRVQSVHQKHRD